MGPQQGSISHGGLPSACKHQSWWPAALQHASKAASQPAIRSRLRNRKSKQATVFCFAFSFWGGGHPLPRPHPFLPSLKFRHFFFFFILSFSVNTTNLFLLRSWINIFTVWFSIHSFFLIPHFYIIFFKTINFKQKKILEKKVLIVLYIGRINGTNKMPNSTTIIYY